MTEDEREELIEKMARALYEREYDKDHYPWDKEEYKTPYLEDARAALAVAEPVIREQCARIAEGELLHFPKLTKAGKGYNQACNEVAAAIREGGKHG